METRSWSWSRELARRAALAIDNARLYSDLQRLEQRLEAVLANLAEAITVVDNRGRTIFANQAAADLLGFPTPEELTHTRPGTVMPDFIVLDEQGRELDLECMPARRLFRGEQVEPLLVRNIVRATGEERWLIVRSSPIRDPETERIDYVANVFENITEVKHAQLAERFMAEASRVLASSMDYGETLQRVARLAVPQIADWCAVDLLDERGDRTGGGAPRRPAQARAGRASRPPPPPGARRAGGGARGDPHRTKRASSTTSSRRRSRLTRATPSIWSC